MATQRKEREEAPSRDPYAWMVTFSDLVMLLLTFFVMLLTMGSMDKKQLKALFTHFSDAAGVQEFSGTSGISDLASFIKEYRNLETIVVIDQSIVQNLITAAIEPDPNLDLEGIVDNIREGIHLSDDERGIILSFHEKIVFKPGEARIKEEVFPILDVIARTIDSCPNPILIMGHTDDVPFRSAQYESNWELSAYRGLAILDYFVNNKELPQSRFSVGGYGPSRPLHPNDSPEHRALNRRVEIIFKHT